MFLFCGGGGGGKSSVSEMYENTNTERGSEQKVATYE